MTRNMFTLLLSIIFVLDSSLSFDVRRGMKVAYDAYERNKVCSTSESPLVNIPKPFLKKMEKTEKKLKELDIVKKIVKLGDTQKKNYQEKFAEVKVDHFNFGKLSTFKLRYLVNEEHFDRAVSNSPILFYCGNEGPIEEFWNNSGFITEVLAREFKGLVIFGEHRFFGKSFPFGGVQDYDLEKNQYLTVEQAMADFVELLQTVRKTYNIADSHPIIAFGGSYGGMLAAWSRMKFPHIYAGAIASSAPILLFEDIDRISNSFFKIVTETYRRYDEKCPTDIRKGFRTLEALRNSTASSNNDAIFKEISSIFNLCSPIENSQQIKMLEEYIEDALVGLAQYNYPYETNFLNPTPGYPVKVACENIAKYRNETGFSSLLMGGEGIYFASYITLI